MPASWRTPLRVTGGGAPTSSHGSCSEEVVHCRFASRIHLGRPLGILGFNRNGKILKRSLKSDSKKRR